MTRSTYSSIKMRLIIVSLISSFFLLMYAGGAEEHVSVLAGAHSGHGWERLLGFCYILLYMLIISLIPILAISILVSLLPLLWKTRGQAAQKQR